MTNVNPPTTASAAAHAERIKAREQSRAQAAGERDTRQTYEIYGERAAAGYRVDEAARERARLDELRARGVISADPEPEDVEYEDEDVEEVDDEPEAETPKTTAEIYGARELERQKHEHELYRAATRGVAAHAAEQARRIW